MVYEHYQSYIYCSKEETKIYKKDECVQAPEAVGACGSSEWAPPKRRPFGEVRMLPVVLLLENHCCWWTEPPQGELVTLLWQSFLD